MGHPQGMEKTVRGDRPDRSSTPRHYGASLEHDFLEFTRRYGLPTPLTNTTVLGYEVDAFFPEHRVIVEVDGYGYHSSKDSFESDRERDAATLAAGLQTVRITSERMNTTPAREAKRLHT